MNWALLLRVYDVASWTFVGVTGAIAASRWMDKRKREKAKREEMPESIEFQLDCDIHTTQIEEARQ